MKIGTLTWGGCEGCINYDSRLDCCELDEIQIAADGEDVHCVDFAKNNGVEALDD